MLVANLVTNAVRHGRADGHVEVTLTPEAVLQVDGASVEVGDSELGGARFTVRFAA